MSRTSKVVLILGGLFGTLLFWIVIHPHIDGDTKEAAAKFKISTIERAVVLYKTSHGDFPQSLKDLTLSEDGKKAPLEDSDLLDPWGGTIRYDPSNCHPQTGKPRISTVTPEGDEISNW